MSLAITPALASVNQNRTQTFVGSGGTTPYVYALVSGIGAINASTGVYTAPTQTGVAVVKVTDATNASVQATITVNSALTLFCDIIKTEMQLDNDQVYLWDQKINIPTDQRLYVAVGVSRVKPFGNTRRYDGSGAGLSEELSANFQATLDVTILSRGPDARDRKEEIVLALKSTYSQYQQEANGFYISQLTSSFVNLSPIDGAAIPYRFTISVNIQYFLTKAKSVDYYDTFDENAILVNP